MGSSASRVASTVRDYARALVRLELEIPRSVLAPSLDRTAGFVWSGIRRRLRKRHPEAGPGEVETALEYLADKGLVARVHDEWRVTPRRAQLYRWTRLATTETLIRFADEAVRCAGPDCRKKIVGKKFCSERCHHRGVHLVMAVGGAA
jgi:hypothetical protein